MRHLEPKQQNTYRHLAAKQIKRIITTNIQNTLHKRHQYNINPPEKNLTYNNSRRVNADKTKVIVIINKANINTKVHNFIKEKPNRTT